jgi:hypothetical protein
MTFQGTSPEFAFRDLRYSREREEEPIWNVEPMLKQKAI